MLSTCSASAEQYLAFQRSGARGWVDKIIRRPSMTSPRRFVAPAAPFPIKSPSVPFCKHSGSCLFPGAWNAAGSGRSNPAWEKQKRGSRCPHCPLALHRSSQLQLKACRCSPRRPITGCKSLQCERRPRVGGDEVLRRDSRWRSWLARGEGV